MGVFINEKPGARYGYWMVLKYHRIDEHSDARWWCKCELCGDIYSVRGFQLRNNKSTKCWNCSKRRLRRGRMV